MLTVDVEGDGPPYVLRVEALPGDRRIAAPPTAVAQRLAELGSDALRRPTKAARLLADRPTAELTLVLDSLERGPATQIAAAILELMPPADRPAVVGPAGFTADSAALLLSVEFLGRRGDEGTLLQIAYSYEHHTHHRRLPTQRR
jgi:Asp-tRNA(Asn)/Glu-tRNA(Gln) amidotransferase A subunit family amidase